MAEAGNDYSVGYKKPPKQTRFKKGQSGNPRGRPRQQPTIQTLLSEELGRQLNFNENGRRARDSKLRLMIKQAINRAVAGDFRALTQLGKLQTWLQAVDRERTIRMIESSMSPQEAMEAYMETLRSSNDARGLK